MIPSGWQKCCSGRGEGAWSKMVVFCAYWRSLLENKLLISSCVFAPKENLGSLKSPVSVCKLWTGWESSAVLQTSSAPESGRMAFWRKNLWVWGNVPVLLGEAQNWKILFRLVTLAQRWHRRYTERWPCGVCSCLFWVKTASFGTSFLLCSFALQEVVQQNPTDPCLCRNVFLKLCAWWAGWLFWLLSDTIDQQHQERAETLAMWFMLLRKAVIP